MNAQTKVEGQPLSGLDLLRAPFPPNQISKQSLPPGLSEPCLRFLGAHDREGYGRASLNGRVRGAHQVAYIRRYGAIPEGLELDHLCRVRDCVEPTHLEPVTHAENSRRGRLGQARGEQMRSRTACPQGHSLSGENLYLTPSGHRACKECRRAACRRNYEKARGGNS